MPASPSAAVGVVRQQAAAWYPELGAGEVRVVVEREDRRPQSTLTIARLEGTSATRRVLVKAVFPDGPPVLPARPRLGIGDPGDLHRKHELEWRALELAWRRFGGGTEPGLGAVRPLAFVPEDGAIVVELLDGATLRERLTAASRLRPGGDVTDLPALLRRAGRWIATFHSLSAEVEERRASAAEVKSTAEEFATFLRPLHRTAARLSDVVVAAAERLEGAACRLGFGHGDLAPRNLFVDRAGTVTAIDPLGRWRVPIEEDLAALLIDLRTAGAQTVLAGRAFTGSVLAALELALLDGYALESGDAVDRHRLDVFTGLVLLDRWAATLTRPTTSHRARLTMALVRRRLAAETERVITALDAPRAWA